jgi:hypothetical protein
MELSDSDDDSDERNSAFTGMTQVQQQRNTVSIVKTQEVLVTEPCTKRRRAMASGKVEGIRITRQLVCKNIITLTEIPSCWSVPRPEENTAYLLDLTMDKREWKDADGELMSMASIIKSQVS